MSIWDDLGIGGGDESPGIIQPDGATYGYEGKPVYGGRYQDIKDGKYVQGTSAAEQDVDRYRTLAGRRTMAPWIDRTQSDQARGLEMGSLGSLGAASRGATLDMAQLRRGATGSTTDMRLLEGAARGATPSKAEILGRTMSDRALRSQVSAAGNVRGGAGASAAAYRYASQNAMQQRQDMNQAIQAERAAELDAARRAYSGAMGAARKDYAGFSGTARRDFNQGAGSLRRDDMNLAGHQAEIDQRQWSEDMANERYYEGLANSTNFGVAGLLGGNLDAQQQQRNFERTAQNAEAAADWGKTKDVIGMSTGAVSGGMSGYMSARRDAREQGRYDHDYSDPRAKEPLPMGSLAPIYWDSSGSPIVDGLPFDREAKSFRSDTPKDQVRVKRQEQDEASREADSVMAGYRRSLASGPSVARDEGEIDEAAPGWLADYMASQESPRVAMRDTVTSDPAAKRAAFEDGAKYADHDNAGVHIDPPDYMKTKPQREAKFERNDDARTVARAGYAENVGDFGKALIMPGTAFPIAMKSRVRDLNTGVDQWLDDLGERYLPYPGKNAAAPAAAPTPPPAPATAPPAAPATQPGYRTPTHLADLKQQEANMYSDVRAKRGVSYSDVKTKAEFGTVPDQAMAGAMRSMQPMPYRYKPQFAEASGQAPGEVNVGPMANAMAKDPVAGTAIVRDGKNDMLAIDEDKGLKLVMGSLAALQHQIDSMKGNDGPRAKGAPGYRRGRSVQP